MKKLLIIHNPEGVSELNLKFNYRDVENVIAFIIREFKHKFDLTVLTTASNKLTLNDNYEVKVYSDEKKYYTRRKDMINLISKNNYDIILFTNEVSVFTIQKIYEIESKKEKPAIIYNYIHYVMYQLKDLKGQVEFSLKNEKFKLIASSEFIKSFLIDYTNYDKNLGEPDIKVINPSCSLDENHWVNEDNKKVYDLVYVGYISPEHEVKKLLEYVKFLYNEGEKVDLLLIGDYDTDEKGAFTKYALSCKSIIEDFSNVIHYIPMNKIGMSYETLISYINKAKVFINPCRMEGFGIKSLIAMKLGIPVIAFKDPEVDNGLSSFLKPNANGQYFKSRGSIDSRKSRELLSLINQVQKLSKDNIIKSVKKFNSETFKSEFVKKIK